MSVGCVCRVCEPGAAVIGMDKPCVEECTREEIYGNIRKEVGEWERRGKSGNQRRECGERNPACEGI